MTNDRGMTDLVVLDDLCDFTEFYASRANSEFRGIDGLRFRGSMDSGSQGVGGAFRGILRPRSDSI